MKKILVFIISLIMTFSFSLITKADPNYQIGYSNFNKENNFVVEEEFLVGSKFTLGFVLTTGSKTYDIPPYEVKLENGETKTISTDEDYYFVFDFYYRYYLSQKLLEKLYLTGFIGYNFSDCNSSSLYGGNIGYKYRFNQYLNFDIRYNIRLIDSETFKDVTLTLGYHYK